MSMTLTKLKSLILYAQQDPGALAKVLLPVINGPLLGEVLISGAASIKLLASGNKTSQFTASFKDVDGEAIESGVVMWSLKAAHTGASIDPHTGLLTLADSTVPADITIVATGWGVKAEKVVTILAAPVVTTITVDGAAEVQLDDADPVTSPFTAAIKDQYNLDIEGTIVWSIKAPGLAGVSINGSTGVLTATAAVVPGPVIVVATIGAVSDEFEVTIVAAAGA